MIAARSILVVVALVLGVLAPRPALAQVRTLRAVTYAGRRYVDLKDLAGMYGLPLTEPGNKKLLIRGQYLSVLLTMDGREAMINGSKVWLHAPVIKLRSGWAITDADAQFIVDPLVRPSAYLGARGTRTVVLDAGHGGKDPGALGRGGLMEKDLALDIARRTAAHLRANGVRVVMTRDGDQSLTLQDRPFLAARGGGDVFVSIHLNAVDNRSVHGVETFVTAAEHYPPTANPRLTGRYPAVANNRFNHSNAVLGHHIQQSLVGITRAEDRGLKRARFQVLRDAAMPAALVECGFISNPQEAQKMSTPSYRETVAQGIAVGILNFLAAVNRAKMELGAPLIQPPVQMAMAAPTAPAPIPMAARAWGPTEVVLAPPPMQAVAPPQLLAPPPPAVEAPAQPVPAPPPAVSQPPAPVVPAAPPAPAPAPPPATPPPMQAVAPPPSRLLNPNLGRN